MLRGYRCVRVIDNTVYIHYEDTVYIPTIGPIFAKYLSEERNSSRDIKLAEAKEQVRQFTPFAVLDV